MNNARRALLAAAFLLSAATLHAQPQPMPERFSFGMISHAGTAGEEQPLLRDALARTDADNLAFVVVNGIKSAGEPCTDKLFQERLKLYEEAENGLVLSLAGSDWSDCHNASGRPVAADRLRRARELFFTDDFSLGASKIPLVRQSTTPKFYTYVENTRWEFGDILFATLNLPANNNQYLAEAGRNGEFEDRLIANRDWLKRLFVIAGSRKFSALVIFSDGSLAPASAADSATRSNRRDGFLEVRNRLMTLAAKYPGKVLLVQGAPAGNARAAAQKTNAADNARAASGTAIGTTIGTTIGTPSATITWQGNLGYLRAAPGVAKVVIDHAAPALITAVESAAGKPAR